jgi:hypothetical protein
VSNPFIPGLPVRQNPESSEYDYLYWIPGSASRPRNDGQSSFANRGKSCDGSDATITSSTTTLFDAMSSTTPAEPFDEANDRFVKEAIPAKRAFEKTGEAYCAAEVFEYFRARLAGEHAQKPALRKWLG